MRLVDAGLGPGDRRRRQPFGVQLPRRGDRDRRRPPRDERQRRELQPDHRDDAFAPAGQPERRDGDEHGRHHGHAAERLDRRLPRRARRAQFYSFVTTLVRNAITVGRRRRQLRRRPGHAAPADGGLPAEGEVRPLLRAAAVRRQAFPDVPCSFDLRDWINELVAQGITGGCGGGNLLSAQSREARPDGGLPAEGDRRIGLHPAAVRRGRSRTSRVRRSSLPGSTQLVAENITGGCGGGNYCPLDNNTRGQMAVFITKTFSLQ